MKISIIAAIGRNGELGKEGSLPWRISEDLKFFKHMTEGNTIVMGRKTYESIGKALPNRKTIVLTTQEHYILPDAIVATSAIEVIRHARIMNLETLYICGGGQIYSAFLPLAQQMYLTNVDDSFDADVFFPHFTHSDWQLTSVRHSSNDKYKYRFEHYERADN